MALLPSGADSGFGTPSNADDGYVRLARQLDAFWLERTEVSNASYRQFVEETGHRWPALWGSGGQDYDTAWDDLPIVNVTFRDAQAFAEWRGKRLPTALEWQRAARGVANRRFPWTDDASQDADAVRLRANAWRDTNDPHRPWLVSERLRNAYLASVRPVSSTDHEDVCSESILHMFGNVQEWTESPAFPEEFNLPPEPLSRVVCGAAWGDPPEGRWHLHSTGFDHMDGFVIGRGFRCAKSFSA